MAATPSSFYRRLLSLQIGGYSTYCCPLLTISQPQPSTFYCFLKYGSCRSPPIVFSIASISLLFSTKHKNKIANFCFSFSKNLSIVVCPWSSTVWNQYIHPQRWTQKLNQKDQILPHLKIPIISPIINYMTTTFSIDPNRCLCTYVKKEKMIISPKRILHQKLLIPNTGYEKLKIKWSFHGLSTP